MGLESVGDTMVFTLKKELKMIHHQMSWLTLLPAE